MKPSLIIFISLCFTLNTLSQANKQNILKYFNEIEYYPDSTIKCAYNIKNGMRTGLAIEFDSTGKPLEIGKYKRNKKNGYWYTSGGIRWDYKNGDMELGVSDNEGQEEQEFKEIYHKILHLPN